MSLEIKAVTKRFGGLVAVNDVTFKVDDREIVGLIGPNGAGKTTLFNIVAGVFPPDEGRISFRGQDITGMGTAAVCRLGLSRTFQIPQPFTSMTVLQATMVGCLHRTADISEARELALGVIARVGLSEREELSTGALTTAGKKRLEIARALATGPSMILLDEVMAGLNRSEVQDILDLIRALRDEGTTVLLVEHNLEAVMNVSERIVVLDHGEVIAEGAPKAVVQDKEVIRAYLGDEVDDAVG
ncbi:MAG: ABC transporter ATP-binding protein [Alphaproteobacteria bacterium]|nr:ABC transporter ATP-binding protein [Alphaproteobacteria bacterium]MDX5369823.1 ABC transporter ATP-binding protein [Alphaproteobacteria bacterium]